MLSNQHIRREHGYPDQLAKLNSQLKTGKSVQLKVLSRRERYQQLTHDYSMVSGTCTLGTGSNFTTMGMFIQDKSETSLTGPGIRGRHTPTGTHDTGTVGTVTFGS